MQGSYRQELTSQEDSWRGIGICWEMVYSMAVESQSLNAELADIKRVDWKKEKANKSACSTARKSMSPLSLELGKQLGIPLSKKLFIFLATSPLKLLPFALLSFLSFHAKLAFVSCYHHCLCLCYPCSNRNPLLEPTINPSDTQSCFQHRKCSVCEQYDAGRSNAACIAGHWQVHLVRFFPLVSTLTSHR